MNPRLIPFLWILALLAVSCGSTKPEPGTSAAAKPAAGGGEEPAAEQDPVVSAQSRIKEWLGTDLSGRIASLGKELGKEVGLKLAGDQEVASKAKGLSKVVLKDQQIKKTLEAVADDATAGFANKLTLGWKAITSGGVSAYKQKVKENTMRVAVEVLNAHLRDHILKDERMAQIFKDFAPALKVQGKVAAVALQENLSPKVTKKILSIALKIAAAGDKAEMASRVELWIDRCDGHAQEEVEKLLRNVARLPAVTAAVHDLALAVIDHETTKRELTELTRRLVTDDGVKKGLTKVYNAAAFDKGDGEIRKALVALLAQPVIDKELFNTLERLAGSTGGGPMIGRHLVKVTEDPALASLVEDFVMSVLEGCGDPTETPEEE